MSDQAETRLRWLERGPARGDDQPVVLLHGLMGHMHDWDDVLDGLGASTRALAPELPLFHRRQEAMVEALAAWVIRFLDALEIEHAVVGGNSLGGHVALAVALGFPERVSGLVLTGSSGLFERSFNRGVPHRPDSAWVRARMEQVFYDRALVTEESVEAIRRTLADRASALRVLQLARAVRRHSVADRLGDITVPTLIVWGADDRITPPAVAERFHSGIPGSKLVVLRTCGHAAMLERPAPFASAVREWLDDTRVQRERRMETCPCLNPVG